MVSFSFTLLGFNFVRKILFHSDQLSVIFDMSVNFFRICKDANLHNFVYCSSNLVLALGLACHTHTHIRISDVWFKHWSKNSCALVCDMQFGDNVSYTTSTSTWLLPSLLGLSHHRQVTSTTWIKAPGCVYTIKNNKNRIESLCVSRLSNFVDENQIRLQRWHALGELAEHSSLW